MLLHAPCLRRAARTPLQHTQWRRSAVRCYASRSGDEAAWFTELRNEMLGRPLPSARENLDRAIVKKLLDTLSTFLPPECSQLRGRAADFNVPMGHHLVWFNTSMPADKLLADGTDPLHSPGAPWTRRMWAGGQLELRPGVYFDSEKGFVANSDVVCAERIKDVRLAGQGDAEKIFVTIERRYARNDALHARRVARRAEYGKRGTEPSPQALFRDQLSEEAWGDALLREERNLVFLKEKTTAELEAITAGQLQPVKYLDSPGTPDFSHVLTPSRLLLFRYSALTFNAHLIHLDRDYARKVEGHRNLLVHGPLSLTLLLQAVGAYIKEKSEGRHALASITYRNLAPLYCDEEMRICCKLKKALDTGDIYNVWIEGPTGGAAVVGTVQTVPLPSIKGDRNHPHQSEDHVARKGTSPTSPTLDPQPGNVQIPTRREPEGPSTGLSSHRIHWLDQPFHPDLLNFTIPPSPPRYDLVDEVSPSKSNTVMTRDMPTELEPVAVSDSALKHPNLVVPPTSVVRGYKSQPYQPDSADISARHSRYTKDGVRKIDQPRIVEHGSTLSRPRRQRD